MIYNTKQLRTAERRLADAVEALAATEKLAGSIDPDILNSELVMAHADVGQLTEEVGRLKKEVDHYKQLRESPPLSFSGFAGDIPRMITEARISRGLTHSSAAAAVGKHEQQWQRWEQSNFSGFKLAQLPDLEDGLGFDIAVEFHRRGPIGAPGRAMDRAELRRVVNLAVSHRRRSHSVGWTSEWLGQAVQLVLENKSHDPDSVFYALCEYAASKRHIDGSPHSLRLAQRLLERVRREAPTPYWHARAEYELARVALRLSDQHESRGEMLGRALLGFLESPQSMHREDEDYVGWCYFSAALLPSHEQEDFALTTSTSLVDTEALLNTALHHFEAGGSQYGVANVYERLGVLNRDRKCAEAALDYARRGAKIASNAEGGFCRTEERCLALIVMVQIEQLPSEKLKTDPIRAEALALHFRLDAAGHSSAADQLNTCLVKHEIDAENWSFFAPEPKD